MSIRISTHTRDRPKSAIMRSASSATLRKSRFSGLRSVILELALTLVAGFRLLTSMHDALIMKIIDCTGDNAYKMTSIAFVIG